MAAPGVADNEDDQREILPYPGTKSKSEVWKYFGFYRKAVGPPTRQNLDMSRAVCKLCRRTYANKGTLSVAYGKKFGKTLYIGPPVI